MIMTEGSGGGVFDGCRIVSLDQFLNLAGEKDTEIMVGTKHETALFFLRDACGADSKVYALEGNQWVRVDFGQLGDLKRDAIQIEKNKLREYEESCKVRKGDKNTKAHHHAENYIRWRREHLSVPEITGVELTNTCNLKCANCPTPTSVRPKGFMSDEVFYLALKYVSPYRRSHFSLHGLGEPLLHPKFVEYLERVAEIDLNAVISTNGILLDKNMAREIFRIFKTMSNVIFYISFHTKLSVERWCECMDLIRDCGHVRFYGQVLEHNRQQAEKWLLEVGIKNPEQHPNIRYISSHSFAGNVAGRKTCYRDIEVANRIRNCYSFQGNTTSVAWNGLLKTCCYDSETTGECGSIFEYEKARLNQKGYPLCRYCDPDWTSNYQ